MNGSKKLLILYILDVLRQYSDSDHRLKQDDIIRLIKEHYGMDCERKAIARNITALQDFDYDIEYKDGYYLVGRDFDDSELRLLIDGVLASRHIPASRAKELIGKLERLSSIYFQKRMRHVCNISQMGHSENQTLFYVIDILDEAIEKNRQVKFFYNHYGIDKKLHHLHEFKATVNPYQMIVANGRYYLIGNNDKFDNVVHWRIDLITDIEPLDTPSKPMEKVKGFEHGLDLPRHLAEHIYMFTGESVRVKMRVKNGTINDVIDWFGTDVSITPENEDTCIVRLKANERAMFYWALQFGNYVEILEPEGLRNEIKRSIMEMKNSYNSEGLMKEGT
jgi:predicted DNA-binding transcriptional regulator YafY